MYLLQYKPEGMMTRKHKSNSVSEFLYHLQLLGFNGDYPKTLDITIAD